MPQVTSPRPVIVGADGRDAALTAARFALDEARRRSADERALAKALTDPQAREPDLVVPEAVVRERAGGTA